MKFEVLTAVWGADDATYVGGTHEILKPTVAQLRLLAGAEAAGVVRIIEGDRKKLSRYLQSQEQGERAYARAQKSGAWHEGNEAQHKLEKKQSGKRGG